MIYKVEGNQLDFSVLSFDFCPASFYMQADFYVGWESDWNLWVSAWDRDLYTSVIGALV